MAIRKHLENLKKSESHQIIVFKGFLLKRLSWHMLTLGLYTALLRYLQLEAGVMNLSIGLGLPGLMGAALGILLVFRNQTAYDRWWEGRKVWGSLVNVSRNIAIEVNNLISNDQSVLKARFASLLSAVPYSLKEHLREGVKMDQLDFMDDNALEELGKYDHKPNGVMNIMMRKMKFMYDEKLISDYQFRGLMRNTERINDVIGICERIKSTPIPVSHNFLLKSFLFIYHASLPLGLVHDLGWWSVSTAILVNYLLTSMVVINQEIEVPFGRDPNDLPTDNLADKISKDVGEILVRMT